MSKATFKTKPVSLETLLKQCAEEKNQLPDFQSSWGWAEDRILSLIASISSSFPIGALMTLASNNGSNLLARCPAQSAPDSSKDTQPAKLLLPDHPDTVQSANLWSQYWKH